MNDVQLYQTSAHEVRKKLRPVVIGGTLLISFVITQLPVPEGLTQAGLNALAIFFLSCVFWVTNAIPLMITSMLAIVLLPLLGVLDEKTAYALFGNQAVFFILGAFILASAIMRSGLSTRIALRVLNRFDKDQRMLLLAILLLPAALALVMSEHAVVAMMFPIVMEIVIALKLTKEDRLGTALFLAMAWGAIIGGIGTFLGGARAILAVGILEEVTGETISFIDWMLAAMPLVFSMLIIASVVLLFISRKETHSLDKAVKHLNAKVAHLGPVSFREKFIAVLMIVTIALWVTLGHEFGLANIAFLAVVVAFIFKQMSWKEVQEDVNWGVILMYGGAIALGFALDQSGAALWLTDVLLRNMVTTGIGLIILLSVLSKVLTEGMSNTAVVALLTPIAIALSLQYGVDARIGTLALAIPSGLAFMLPISTPATAIAISSGYVKVVDTVRYGLILNIISVLLFAAVAIYYWPLIGLQ